MFLCEIELFLVWNYFRTNHFCCWELRNPDFLRTDTGRHPLTTMSFIGSRSHSGGLIFAATSIQGWPLLYTYKQNFSPLSWRFPLLLMPRRGTQTFSSKGRFLKVLFLENVVSIHQIPIQNSMATQRIVNTLFWGKSWTISLAYPQITHSL